MAIYNVNKDTGDITETAGRYGSSNSVFYGTIAQWNALTIEQKKAYDHASIPDSLDGNVTFPASKVMLNSGDSVEDRLDVKTIDDTFTTDSYGRFTISSLTNKKISILRAYVPDNSYIVTPYSYYNSTTQAIVTYFKITRSDTTVYTVVASTSVTIHIDYVEF